MRGSVLALSLPLPVVRLEELDETDELDELEELDDDELEFDDSVMAGFDRRTPPSGSTSSVPEPACLTRA